MPDSPANSSNDRPIRRISSWKVFGIFCLVSFMFLVGVAFLPWDAPMPEAPDLEYTPPIIPDAENAFTYIRTAGQLSKTKFETRQGDPWEFVLVGMIGKKYEAWDPFFADEVLAANAIAFAELDKGLACQCYASPKPASIRAFQPGESTIISLARLLDLKSKRAHLSGNYEEATRVALQKLRLGEMTSQGNSMSEWWIGNSIQATALSRLSELAHDVKTPEPRLKEILAMLDRWDPQDSIQRYRHAALCEYETWKDSITFVQDGVFPFSNEAFLARIPYSRKHRATLQLMVPFYRTIIARADKPFSQVKPNYPGKCEMPTGKIAKNLFYLQPNSLGKLMLGELSETHLAYWSKKCLLQANVAAVRLQIGLRLYEQKYGQLPDSLSALVPEYLKEIPRDPYDDLPFRYSKSERKVWAVGKDLQDQRGRTAHPNYIMVDRENYDPTMPIEIHEMRPKFATPENNSSEWDTK